MIYFLTVNYYSSDWIGKLYNSIQAQSELVFGWQLVIVNNSLDDRAIATLASDLTPVTLVNAPGNIGFGQACNLGLDWIDRQDPNALVWLINPDANLSSGALTQVQDLLIQFPEIAILGTVIKDQQDRILFSGGSFDANSGSILEQREFPLTSSPVISETNWLSGCSLILNLVQFSQLPQFDPAYFLYYEDFDLCQRLASQGYKIWIANHIFVYHHTSAIAKNYPIFKIQHEIYSYLVSLEKYCSRLVFYRRFLRIFLAAFLQFPIYPQRAIGKFKGLIKLGLFHLRINLGGN